MHTRRKYYSLIIFMSLTLNRWNLINFFILLINILLKVFRKLLLEVAFRNPAFLLKFWKFLLCSLNLRIIRLKLHTFECVFWNIRVFFVILFFFSFILLIFLPDLTIFKTDWTKSWTFYSFIKIKRESLSDCSDNTYSA